MTSETLQLNQALAIFEENIPDIKIACIENIQAVIDDERGLFREDFIRLRTEGLRRVLKRIVGIQQHKYQPKVGGVTDAMVARAKEFSIEEMYDGRLRKGCGLCPFHQEKTPSFNIKNNKFNCFGCGEHGDAIDFHMKINNVGFIQAVKAMQ